MATTPVPLLGQARSLTTPHNNHSERSTASSSSTSQKSEQRCSWWPRGAQGQCNTTVHADTATSMGHAIGLAAQLTHKHKRGDTTHRTPLKHTCTHNTGSTSATDSTWPTTAPTPAPHLGQARSLTTPHNNHSEGHPANSSTTQRSEHRCR